MKQVKFITGLMAFGVVSLFAGCGEKENEMTKVTLNEVAHSIFYAPQYVALENGYFTQEGLDLDLVTGYGADKTMAAVISGEAQIGFMGAEASVYAYLEGANDPVINFAQGTQRAGNFLVAREEMADFQWSDLKGKEVLGGRKGGMPEMVFEYILKENGLDPAKELSIDQSIDFGSTAAAFSGSSQWNLNRRPQHLKRTGMVLWLLPLVSIPAMFPILPTAQRPATSKNIRRSSRPLPTVCKKEWTM